MEGENGERINDMIIRRINTRGHGPARGKRAAMGNFRPRNKKFDKNAYEITQSLGHSQSVDIFVPGHADRSDATVAGMSWSLAADAPDKYYAAAMFAGAVGSVSPHIRRAISACLSQRGININSIEVPEEATAREYETEGYAELYSYEERLLSFGISLLLPFKHISERNFDKFINATKRALGGTIGLMDNEITRYRYPLDLLRSRMVKSVMAGSKAVRQEILNFIMWASELTDDIGTVARYVSQIISWNEMNLIVFINNVFVDSLSPVLNHPMVQDEVKNFQKALIHITRASCPHYFKYFCSPEEELMIQRNNFPILGAVAQELLNKKSNNDSMLNFAGTAEQGSDLVKELVSMHEEFCKTSAVSSK